MILQVLPPGSGGVRDFAEGLGAAWLDAGHASHLLEGRRDSPDRLSRQLLPESGAPPLRVVIHFSGYGYAPRGLCQWLVDELTEARSSWRAEDRMLVVFHELFAVGPPWRSAFWLSPIQERIASRLTRLADGLWTNTEHHARWLRRQRPELLLHPEPVFSNIGEPGPGPGWAHRERRALVFGAHGTRLRALQALKGREKALAHWGIDELVHIGSGPAIDLPLAIRQRHLGRLDGSALTEQFQTARFGLLDYPAKYLGKSGVFAAYAAHGCLPLNTHHERRTADGLVEGRHYVMLGRSEPLSQDSLATLGQHAESWYRPHARAAQAQAMLAGLTAR